MTLLAFSGFLNGFLVLFLGIFVFVKNKGKSENKLFFLFSLATAFWQFNYGFWQIAQSEEESILFLRLLMIGGALSAVLFYHLSLVLLNLIQSKRKSLYCFYIITFLIFILIFSPFFVSKFKIYSFYNYWPIAGVGANLTIIWSLVLALYSFILLIKNYFQLTGEKKNQIGYFILAVLLGGWIGGAFNLPQWYGIELYPYGNFLIFLYPLIIAFAILRYHLFGIKIILTELLVGIMGIILLILPFLMPTTFLKILTTIVFLLFCVFGYYLIKYTRKEEELRKQAEDLAEGLKQLNEAKTVFINTAAHDLRAPLLVFSLKFDKIIKRLDLKMLK